MNSHSSLRQLVLKTPCHVRHPPGWLKGQGAPLASMWLLNQTRLQFYLPFCAPNQLLLRRRSLHVQKAPQALLTFGSDAAATPPSRPWRGHVTTVSLVVTDSALDTHSFSVVLPQQLRRSYFLKQNAGLVCDRGGEGRWVTAGHSGLGG